MTAAVGTIGPIVTAIGVIGEFPAPPSAPEINAPGPGTTLSAGKFFAWEANTEDDDLDRVDLVLKLEGGGELVVDTSSAAPHGNLWGVDSEFGDHELVARAVRGNLFTDSAPVPVRIVPAGLLALWLVGSNENVTVPELGDDSGAGLVISANSFGDDPESDPDALGAGEHGITFGSNRTLHGAEIVDFRKLHSGAVEIVLRIRPTGALSSEVIFSTRTVAAAATHPGVIVTYNGSSQFFQASQHDAAGTPVINLSGAVGSSPRNNTYTVIITFNPAGTSTLEVNGSVLDSDTHSGALSNADAVQPIGFALGVGSGTNVFSGSLKLCSIHEGTFSAEERTYWQTVAPTVDSIRTVRRWRAIGDSTTEGGQSHRRKIQMRYTRTPNERIVWLGSRPPSGNFPLPSVPHDGWSGQTITEIQARVAPYVGTEPDFVLSMVGANNQGNDPQDSLDLMDGYLAEVEDRHPTARHLVLSLHYCIGTGPWSAVGNTGVFNAGLPGLIDQYEMAEFVDIHAVDNPHRWYAPTDGEVEGPHAQPSGGDAVGNTVADHVEIGSDDIDAYPYQLVHWIDAADLTVGTLTTWNDKSTANTDATGINSPTVDAAWPGGGGLLKRAVGNGTNQRLDVDALAAFMSGSDKPFTLIFAIEVLALDANFRAMFGAGRSSSGTPFQELYKNNITNGIVASKHDDAAGASTPLSASAITVGAHVVEYEHTGIVVNTWVDGQAFHSAISQNLGTTTLDTFSWFARRLLGVASLHGNYALGEARAWNRVLASDRRQLEATTLRAKWLTP